MLIAPASLTRNPPLKTKCHVKRTFCVTLCGTQSAVWKSFPSTLRVFVHYASTNKEPRTETQTTTVTPALCAQTTPHCYTICLEANRPARRVLTTTCTITCLSAPTCHLQSHCSPLYLDFSTGDPRDPNASLQ